MREGWAVTVLIKQAAYMLDANVCLLGGLAQPANTSRRGADGACRPLLGSMGSPGL